MKTQYALPMQIQSTGMHVFMWLFLPSRGRWLATSVVRSPSSSPSFKFDSFTIYRCDEAVLHKRWWWVVILFFLLDYHFPPSAPPGRDFYCCLSCNWKLYFDNLIIGHGRSYASYSSLSGSWTQFVLFHQSIGLQELGNTRFLIERTTTPLLMMEWWRRYQAHRVVVALNRFVPLLASAALN